MANVLVVTTVETPEQSLSDSVDAEDTVKVVVPVVRQGLLDWLANDERAFAHAADVAERTANVLPAETVAAVPGEADVELAIQDALATFEADEILVALHPGDERSFGEAVASEGTPTRTFHGVPVRVVVVSEPDEDEPSASA
jgi:hypothetical protein